MTEEEEKTDWLLEIELQLGWALCWLANWLFIRPTLYLWGMKRLSTAGLVTALHRNDLIDKYGIEGCTLIKSFADTYLTNENERGKT